MYEVEIFRTSPVEWHLKDFLNSNNIKPEDIVSISMSSDSDATERYTEHSVDRIILVYIKR